MYVVYVSKFKFVIFVSYRDMNLVLILFGVELLKGFLGFKVLLNGGIYFNKLCVGFLIIYNICVMYELIFCFDFCGCCLCLVVVVVEKEIKVG